jgi:uncharacterized protein YqgC (DUF456 family)
MSILQILAFIVAMIVCMVGLAGIILPVLPGAPIIFTGILFFSVVTAFKIVTWQFLLIFAGLTAFALVVDYIANYYGVKKMGGRTIGAIGAVIGLIVGLFIHWAAVIILPFLFAVTIELIAGTRSDRALKAGTGAWIGLIFGGLLRFIIGCVMIGLFTWLVLF